MTRSNSRRRPALHAFTLFVTSLTRCLSQQTPWSENARMMNDLLNSEGGPRHRLTPHRKWKEGTNGMDVRELRKDPWREVETKEDKKDNTKDENKNDQRSDEKVGLSEKKDDKSMTEEEPKNDRGDSNPNDHSSLTKKEKKQLMKEKNNHDDNNESTKIDKENVNNIKSDSKEKAWSELSKKEKKERLHSNGKQPVEIEYDGTETEKTETIQETGGHDWGADDDFYYDDEICVCEDDDYYYDDGFHHRVLEDPEDAEDESIDDTEKKSLYSSLLNIFDLEGSRPSEKMEHGSMKALTDMDPSHHKGTNGRRGPQGPRGSKSSWSGGRKWGKAGGKSSKNGGKSSKKSSSKSGKGEKDEKWSKSAKSSRPCKCYPVTRRPSSRPTRRPHHQIVPEPTTRRPTQRPHHPFVPKPTTRRPTQKPSRTRRPHHPFVPKPATRRPTQKPSRTRRPTLRPSHPPTASPTRRPTRQPSKVPTNLPTLSPVSSQPTKNPTIAPTGSPSRRPTTVPTRRPTTPPSRNPTKSPSRKPTNNPTISPGAPFRGPTHSPTTSPTRRPSPQPSNLPTNIPTVSPVTSQPTKNSTVVPNGGPSRGPTTVPTRRPATLPTINPTKSPSRKPANNPTISPAPPSTQPPTKPSTPNPTVSPTTQAPTKPLTPRPNALPTTQAPTQAIFIKVPFTNGTTVNLDRSIPSQLQLDSKATPFNFIWVPLSNLGLVVKVDTDTGVILGTYRTSPSSQGLGNPSRTAVDSDGSVWVANRKNIYDGQGSIVHIGLLENNQCEDRNGIPGIQTSISNISLGWANATGLRGVGTAEDECIIHYTKVNSTGTRHLSVTANNDIWVSGYEKRAWDLVKGGGYNETLSGTILRSEKGWNGYGGYGGLIDKKGIIWSSKKFLRWDPSTTPGTLLNQSEHDSYGLCIDSKGNVWNTALSKNEIRKFDPDGHLIGTFKHGSYNAQGCVVDKNDDVWVAHSNAGNSVGHLNNNGTWIATVTVGKGPTGVAVDGNGKIWSTNLGSNTLSRINPNNHTVDMTVDLPPNSGPYTYGDMTGRNVISQPNTGTWNFKYTGMWKKLQWTPDESSGSSLVIRARNSITGGWVIAENGIDLPLDSKTQYLEVEVIFNRASGKSPILFEMRIIIPT